MGPIQTALGQALTAVGGAAIVGKKIADERAERQVAEKQEKEAKEGEARAKAMAEALSQAVSYKISEPIYFAKSGEPLATTNEMAALVADTSLMNFRSAKDRTRESIKARMMKFQKEEANFADSEPAKKEEFTTDGR